MSNNTICDGSIESDKRSHRDKSQHKTVATLNDFEIGAKIGAGTFGVILRAIDKRTNKEYALKKLDKAQI